MHREAAVRPRNHAWRYHRDACGVGGQLLHPLGRGERGLESAVKCLHFLTRCRSSLEPISPRIPKLDLPFLPMPPALRHLAAKRSRRVGQRLHGLVGAGQHVGCPKKGDVLVQSKGDWEQELWDAIVGFQPGSGFQADRAVVFGRSSVLERWIVVYASVFPTTRRSFQSAIHSVVHSSTVDTWCIVLGKVPAGGRKVVTLFSDKWMVYDRYGQFHFKTVTQLS